MSDHLLALWNDPKNWNRDTSYDCASDPRVFVPNRFGPGWTLNMAHRRAQAVMWTFLLAIVAIVVALGMLAIRRA